MQYRKEPENTVAVSISKSMTDMCCLYFAWSVELLRINSSHGRFPLHLYPLCVLLPSTAARYTFWWSWPWKSAGSKLWPIMQPICCCEEVTLVSSGVLGKDWRLSGLCALSPALKILPTSSVHMQLWKLDMDYGGVNNKVFMVPSERQMIHNIQSEVTETELQKRG